MIPRSLLIWVHRAFGNGQDTLPAGAAPYLASLSRKYYIGKSKIEHYFQTHNRTPHICLNFCIHSPEAAIEKRQLRAAKTTNLKCRYFFTGRKPPASRTSVRYGLVPRYVATSGLASIIFILSKCWPLIMRLINNGMAPS